MAEKKSIKEVIPKISTDKAIDSTKLSSVSSETVSLLRIIAKNFLSVPVMARDLNVTRQNYIKLNKIAGIESTNKADAMFMKEGELEKKLETQKEKYGSKSPEQIKPESKKKETESKLLKDTKVGKALGMGKTIGGIVKCMASCFGPKVITGILVATGLVTLLVTTIWDSISESVGGFFSNIWDSFKETIGGFVDYITENIISVETLKSIGEWVVMWPLKIGELVAEFFGFTEVFENGVNEIKKFLGFGVKPKKPETQSPDNTKLQTEKKGKEIGGEFSTDEKGNIKEGENKRIDEETRQRAKKSVTKKAEPPTTAPAPTPAPSAKKGAGAAPPSTAPSKEAAPPTVGGDDKWIMDMIKKHEGVRTRPYKDSLGLWTVGVGHLIGDGKTLPPEWNREFTMAEVDALFAKDYEHHKEMAKKIPGFDSYNKATQGALIDLTFNMGGVWYKKWPNFVKALTNGNMQQAAEELRNSKWYEQVKGRAQTIISLIKSGGTAPSAVAEAKPMTAQPPSAAPAATPGGEVASTGSGGGGSLSSAATKASGVDLSGLNPEFEKRLTAMASAFKEKTGKSLLITSGFRSNEKQKELWDKALAANGGNEAVTRKKVAEPMPPLGKGKGSFHLKGLAIDINSKGPDGLNSLAGSRDAPTGWLEKFGLTRPVPGEDWHVQATGLAGTPDNPSNPGAPTLVAGKDGKPTEVNSGKGENIPAGSSPSGAASGGAIASASTEVASGQRQQSKPSTPVVVNAPQTTTTIVTKTNNSTRPERNKDIGGEIIMRSV